MQRLRLNCRFEEITQFPMNTESEASIIKGIPLSEEAGLGALTLSGYIREVTERYGDREALVFHAPEGMVRWSYSELYERSMAVARTLRACGVGKDTRVAILMTNRPEWISSFFGVALAGGVACPISTFSTASELEYLLSISCASVLLLERQVLKKDFAAIVTELAPEIGKAQPGALQSEKFPFLRWIATVGEASGGAVEGWDAFLKRGEVEPRQLVEATAATTQPSDAGVIFFSSGSTSKPKGIMSAHRGVCLQMWRWRGHYKLSGDVRCWSANGFFWSGNFGMALGATFSTGGSLVLQPTFQAAEALELMDKEKVNFAVAWPHQWAQLVDAPNWEKVDLSSIQYVDRTTALAKHPTVKTDWREPYAAYGNTETFTISSIFQAGTPEEEIAGSHGRPLPGMTFKIVDPMTGATVRRGDRGEIAVKGATLMLGYLGVPGDETLDENGFFRTGDGGYVDDQGRLYWEGRLNDIIKTGGANVSPLEIDEALQQLPGVKAAQTVGVPHDTLGEIVVSCIVPYEEGGVKEDDVRDFLKERLASYKVPRKILFFREDELTQTGSAKIKTADLRQLAAKRMQG